MGSGISSLTKEEIVFIIKRDLKKELDDYTNTREVCCEGYEIYYDFSEEVNHNDTIKKIDKFVRKELELPDDDEI